ncbi:MAG: hypothetical protein V4440_03115, partial [Pseudomonadota bacterium]
PAGFGDQNPKRVSKKPMEAEGEQSSKRPGKKLSEYGKQAGYSITDGGIGISTAKGKTELDLVAKNLFDKEYTTSANVFSNNAPVGYDGIGARRYVGVVLKSNF